MKSDDPFLPTSISMKREDGIVKEEGEGSFATIAGVVKVLEYIG